ncbi:hypothetical protein Btru_051575 [Bulinus truncatus]|nr:hypothetical protein Btru_051575 [Bulinus truncatus]
MCFPVTTSTASHNYTRDEVLKYLSQLQDQSTLASIPTLVYVSLLIVVGGIGNSLVLVVYWKKMNLTPLRVFIIGMAVCDLLTNILVLPGEIYDLLHVWNFDLPIVCKIRLYLNATFVTSSAFLLVAIANTRYKMVCHPFDPPVSLTRAIYITFLLCIIALVTSLPYAIIQGSQTVNTTGEDISGCVCQLDDIYVDGFWPIVNSSFSFLMFLVGSILIVVFYVNIGRTAWKQRAALIKVQQNCFRQMIKESESGTFISDNDVSLSPDVNVESHDHLSIQRGESTTSESSHNRQTDKMYEKPEMKTNFYLPDSLKKSKMTGDDTENGVGDSSNDVISKTDLETKSGTSRQQYKMSKRILQELNASSSVGTSARSKLIQKRTYLLGRTSCMMLTVTLFFFFGFLPFMGLNIFMAIEPETVAALAGVELAMHTLFLRTGDDDVLMKRLTSFRSSLDIDMMSDHMIVCI